MGCRKRKRLLFRLIAVAIILAVVFYAGVIGYLCISEGSVPKTVPAPENYDAIIVLGAQVKPDGSLSVQLEWRLDTAYEAYQQKPVPVVVCGAKGKNEPVTEAEITVKYSLFISCGQKQPQTVKCTCQIQPTAVFLNNQFLLFCVQAQKREPAVLRK